MAASEELLGRLHDAVAADLLQRVQSGGATPAELNAAIKFLKDNGIEALATEDSTLGKLVDEMPKFEVLSGGLHARS